MRRLVAIRKHTKLCYPADLCFFQAFLVQPTLDIQKQILRIYIPGHGDFDVPFNPPADAERLEDLQVWGSYDLRGHIVSPEGSTLQKALSSIMETSVLLVHFDKSTPRVLSHQQFLSDLFSSYEDSLDYPLEDCTTYFADGYPFLLATEASFKQVDKWLAAETVDTRMDTEELVKRYRPNIVITGNVEPFAEDSWEELRVGDQTIFPVSRCQRCPVSQLYSEAGVRPWLTFDASKYCRCPTSPQSLESYLLVVSQALL
jgi:uncharacterized protein YcbX